MNTNRIYWTTTAVTAGSMAAAAVVYFTRNRKLMASFHDLGYPDYFPPMLGTAKLLGAATLVAPRRGVLKEWAYAGFTITFLAAFVSQAARRHWAVAVAPLASLAIMAVSYVTRPRDRHV